MERGLSSLVMLLLMQFDPQLTLSGY